MIIAYVQHKLTVLHVPVNNFGFLRINGYRDFPISAFICGRVEFIIGMHVSCHPEFYGRSVRQVAAVPVGKLFFVRSERFDISIPALCTALACPRHLKVVILFVCLCVHD